MIWILKRDISDILRDIIYKYGCWHPESSETQFSQYLQFHKIEHIQVFTQTDQKYIHATTNDIKDFTFDEQDLFLIRFKK